MPPKPKPAAPSKKTELKKKEKVIEDKTFGLKNKKGAKQQKFIQQVEKQVKSGGIHVPKDDPKKLEKEKKLKDQKELGLLFKPVQTQKVEKGADPKSVICAFFKQGQCSKGDKCKFSHDLSMERKAEKRSLYVDMRDPGDMDDTMENWDEAKLMDVVEMKHGLSNKKMPATDIICKHFLGAVENSKYGWFWECPSGNKCIYRHALPPGFVLKKDKKKDDKKNELSLEDLIEKERASLSSTAQTRITLETFIAWKKRKIQEKKDAALKEEEKKRSDYKAGRQVGLSGREMFSFNPDLVADYDMEEGDEAFDSYSVDDENEDQVQYRELELDLLEFEAREVDGTGTVAAPDRLKPVENNLETTTTEENIAEVPINENLFVDDDLSGIDDELNDLDVDQ